MSRTGSHIDARSFSVNGPDTWNDLLLELRCMDWSVQSFASVTIKNLFDIYIVLYVQRTRDVSFTYVIKLINWLIDWLTGVFQVKDTGRNHRRRQMFEIWVTEATKDQEQNKSRVEFVLFLFLLFLMFILFYMYFLYKDTC